ncbi:MAG: HAD family hydrolase [Candidatus Omnitrophota bacterium]|jgi:D-glycero-D-manno-heptose 1,7-bisphosphate phosphatase
MPRRHKKNKFSRNTRVVFLDRDGVINRYPGENRFVVSWEGFRFLPGAKRALEKLSAAGYLVFVISNQSGVAKGLYSQAVLDEITDKMRKALEKSQAFINQVYYCVHAPRDNCACRKPKIGLIKKAMKEYGLRESVLAEAFFIGDNMVDIHTAVNAGCKSILVFSGKEKAGNKKLWTAQPDFISRDLTEAVELVLRA